ncbi:hypothetical protein C8R43DRAFT_956169 [Mycena crocata]|nr:hypothetical protein C8R43DRAFT_956169 [Mycena crocata]
MFGSVRPFWLNTRTRGHVLLGTNRPQAPKQTVQKSASPPDNRMSDDGSPPHSRGSSVETDSEPKRRIVDFDLDDGNTEWVDEDAQLDGLGTTTHRSRNRGRGIPVIPVRKHRRRVAGVNVRATATKRRTEKESKMEKLAADLKLWVQEREVRAQELAEKHGMKLKEVRRRMLAPTSFTPKRKVSLYNTKISCIMARLNADRELGERYKIPEVKRMVAADPTMLEGFTEEEEEEMVADVLAKRRTKNTGTRANNLAASADAKHTIERLALEIMRLAERCGMIGFAMFTRGHLHDRTVPSTIQSWGALDFFREVLKKDSADVATLFELWALSKERGVTGSNTLRELQSECTSIIKMGLQTILNLTKIAMNYDNYINVLVIGKGVGLVGWPKGVEFKRMSKQSAIGPLRKLHAALKDGTCHWKELTAGETKRIVSKFKDMVASGEAVEPVRKVKEKSRGKKKSSEKRKSSEKAKTSEKRKSSTKTTKSAPRSGDTGDEDEDEQEDEQEEEEEDDVPRKPIAQMTAREKRERLMSLVQAAKRKGSGTDGSGGLQPKKSSRPREEDDNTRPAKKARTRTSGNKTAGSRSTKRTTVDDTASVRAASGEKGKRKRATVDDDEEVEHCSAKRLKPTKHKAREQQDVPARRTSPRKPTAGGRPNTPERCQRKERWSARSRLPPSAGAPK